MSRVDARPWQDRNRAVVLAVFDSSQCYSSLTAQVMLGDRSVLPA